MLDTETALVKKTLTLNDNDLQLFKTKKVLFNSLKGMLRSVITTPEEEQRQFQLVKCYKWFNEKKLSMNTMPLDIELMKRLKREKIEKRMAHKKDLKDEQFLPPLRGSVRHKEIQSRLLLTNNRLHEL